MIVAQSPGKDENWLGKPFVGTAGKLLAELCTKIGWNLDDLYRTNVNKCWPPGNRKATDVEIRACTPWLNMELETVNPDVIIALGDTAYQWFIPDEDSKITQIRGNVYERVIRGRKRFIIPSVHPAFVARNRTAFEGWLVADLTKAKEVAERGTYTAPSAGFRTNTATWSEVLAVANSAAEFGFDLETDTGNGDDVYGNDQDMRRARIIGLSVCDTPGNGCYYPFESDDEASEKIPQLKAALEDPNRIKIVSNAKFERHNLIGYGIEMRGYKDTMVAAWLLGDQPYSLKDGFHRMFGIEMIRISKFYDMGYKWKNPRNGKYQVDLRAAQDEVPHLVAEYAAQDADASLRLHRVFWDLLVERKLEHLYQTEIDFTEIIVEMEENGFLFDPTRLEDANRELIVAEALANEAIIDLIGYEINAVSTPQCKKALYSGDHSYVIPPAKKKDAPYPTDKVGLAEHIDNPLVKNILQVRALRKMRTTYIIGLPKWMDDAGRIHGEFAQTVAVTGRLASRNPNLQNIPARTRDDIEMPVEGSAIRKAFIASEGNYLYAPDLSQIEMRIAAHMSHDENMIHELTVGDIHSNTARKIYKTDETKVDKATWKNMRYLAKTVGFGVLYGLTPMGLLMRTPSLKLTIAEAAEFIELFYQAYPRLRDYQTLTKAFCRKHGYVESISGRRRYIPDISASDPKYRAEAERAAINMPIQGSAADFFKIGTLNVKEALIAHGLKTRLIAQVHDELVIEGPKSELEALATIVPPILGSAYKLAVPVPVDFEYGENWGDLHKYEPVAA